LKNTIYDGEEKSSGDSPEPMIGEIPLLQKAIEFSDPKEINKQKDNGKRDRAKYY